MTGDQARIPARPLLRRPQDGELIDVAGVAHFFRLTGEHTGGHFSFEEFSLAPGTIGARPHVHEGHDEYFYVLEGELTLHTGDGEVTARPGDLLAATRGTPHGFRNAGAVPARALCLYTPAGYENYFRDVHAAVSAGAEATDELLAEFRSRYGTSSYQVPSDTPRP
ncbi:putative cupin superfamily protein [Streptomyces olivoverticillatus]|uniref:Putative cupin superfamily protein n=1 Tax=Streptomyces olivoverticillatus TaxID=66427 RepID=A0A7W7LMD9_9ACTN|nr:cupin domain-containing protein [Streptomyces olivoverticillatus]MBB4892944.1 putative cupin superfamily protein [Streptomyces olivoverticillatus]